MELAKLLRPIAPALEEVETQIAARAAGRVSVLLRGKRLRPAMLLFAAGAVGPRPNPDAVLAAATVEMVHTASLIHDDVIDAAARRRSGTSLHRLIGVKPAVIFADLLFVQALSALEDFRTAELVHPLIREVRTMCEGQWLEVKLNVATRCTEKQYFDIIEKKTASLYAFCCRAGATLRRAGVTETAALEEFGRNFGLVYQLLDDAEDLDGERQGAVGKSIIARGGRRYLRRAARGAAKAAQRSLDGLPRPVARGLGGLLDYVMEV